MAYYADLFITNKSGVHTFSAGVLTALGLTLTQQQETSDGVTGRWGPDRVLLHKNGRIGAIDLTRDTLVVPITVLQKQSADIQQTVQAYEITPTGA